MSQTVEPLSAKELEAILKALANPLRRDIMAWLRDPARHFPAQPGQPQQDGVCVSHIYEKAAVAQSTVSTYLAMLQRVGLVRSHRVGQWTFYRRDDATIHRFVISLGHSLGCPNKP